MWYKNAGTSFFRFVTILTFDKTDGQTDRPWQYRALHYMQSRGKNNYLMQSITCYNRVYAEFFCPNDARSKLILYYYHYYIFLVLCILSN